MQRIGSGWLRVTAVVTESSSSDACAAWILSVVDFGLAF
jgi:hypothetical protein